MLSFIDWLIEFLLSLLSRIRKLPSSVRLSHSASNVNINVNLTIEKESKRRKKDVIGTIKLFAGDHCPEDWYPCDGRLLKVREYPDLFTVIGNTFGGNGKTTFALPDLRGRVAVGAGDSGVLTVRELGQTFGREFISIKVENMPIKATDNLTFPVSGAENVREDSDDQLVNRLVVSSMKGRKMKSMGDGSPIDINQPSICLNYIICCRGIYPDYLE